MKLTERIKKTSFIGQNVNSTKVYQVIQKDGVCKEKINIRETRPKAFQGFLFTGLKYI